ncbi:MAG: DUF58 domain-containing protein [Polyangiales bacterium]
MSSRARDPSFYARVEALRLRAREVGEAILSGLHASRHQGASVVFADHREYRPGDDPRTLDVRAMARTDRPVVRRFEHEARLPAALYLDVSGSMRFRSRESLPTKAEHAELLLAGLAYVLLRQGDAVAALRFQDAIEADSPLRSQMVSFERTLDVLLAEPGDASRTSLPTVLEQALPRLSRRSLVFLASDLLEPGRPLDGLRGFASAGHRVVVLHVLDPAELEFPFSDSAEFVGLEGESPLTADAGAVRDAYLRAFERHRAALVDACAAASARYVLARTDVPAERVLADLLGGSVL